MKTHLLIGTFCALASTSYAVASDNSNADQPALTDQWSTFPLYSQVGYDQSLRPQFHFTSRMGWLNDPNGMVYYDGEWHMFFQHYAKGNGNGPKSWGTAKSPDLMHWTQYDHVFNPYPNVKIKDGNNHAIWSGSAIVDKNNVLGKQIGDTKTIFATFTATHNNGKANEFFQVGGYSTDKGRSFTMMHDGKPMIDHMHGLDRGQRDPRVFWHEETQSYMMIMMIGGPDRAVRLWRSDDLMNWDVLFDIPNKSAECIDMYNVAVDGDPENRKWVIADAGSHYEVGDFDGKSWNGFGDKDSAGKRLRFEYGDCYYAAQAFNQAPDGRIIHIGWLRSDKLGYRPFLNADMPFTQQMSIPTEITLRNTPDGIRMFRNPVKEIKALYVKSGSLKDLTAGQANAKLKGFQPELIDLTLRFVAGKDFTLNLRGNRIKYAAEAGEFVFENTARVVGEMAGMLSRPKDRQRPYRDQGIRRIPASALDGVVSLRALVDRASLELFVNDGAAAATFVVVADADDRTIAIEGNDSLQIESLVVNELRSIWAAQN
jgi:fructan beta-fructosidase